MVYSSLNGDSGPMKITSTFTYPAGIGASCILKTPFNGTLDLMVEKANFSSINLTAQYYDHMCVNSFKKGEPLSNYVPRSGDSFEDDEWANRGKSHSFLMYVTNDFKVNRP